MIEKIKGETQKLLSENNNNKEGEKVDQQVFEFALAVGLEGGRHCCGGGAVVAELKVLALAAHNFTPRERERG